MVSSESSANQLQALVQHFSTATETLKRDQIHWQDQFDQRLTCISKVTTELNSQWPKLVDDNESSAEKLMAQVQQLQSAADAAQQGQVQWHSQMDNKVQCTSSEITDLKNQLISCTQTCDARVQEVITTVQQLQERLGSSELQLSSTVEQCNKAIAAIYNVDAS